MNEFTSRTVTIKIATNKKTITAHEKTLFGPIRSFSVAKLLRTSSLQLKLNLLNWFQNLEIQKSGNNASSLTVYGSE